MNIEWIKSIVELPEVGQVVAVRVTPENGVKRWYAAGEVFTEFRDRDHLCICIYYGDDYELYLDSHEIEWILLDDKKKE